jgi:hypothetical protein
MSDKIMCLTASARFQVVFVTVKTLSFLDVMPGALVKCTSVSEELLPTS